MSSYETWRCSLPTPPRVRKYIYLRASPAKHVSYPNHLPASGGGGGGSHSELARIRRQEPQVFNVYICTVARYCPAQAKLCAVASVPLVQGTEDIYTLNTSLRQEKLPSVVRFASPPGAFFNRYIAQATISIKKVQKNIFFRNSQNIYIYIFSQPPLGGGGGGRRGIF